MILDTSFDVRKYVLVGASELKSSNTPTDEQGDCQL
jgi:hypothetical protein